MWGCHQEEPKAHIKIFDSGNLKSTAFDVQNRPLSPPKIKCEYHPSTAFEFATNPDKTTPFDHMVDIENNVIYEDGRYSEINMKNRKCAE